MEKKTIIWSVCSLVVGLAIGLLVGINCFNRTPKCGQCCPRPCHPCHQHCMPCSPQHFHGDSTLMPPPGSCKHHKHHCGKHHNKKCHKAQCSENTPQEK